jgi:hypothetical protein
MSKVDIDLAAVRRELGGLSGSGGEGGGGLERAKLAGRLHERLQNIRAEIESGARGGERQWFLAQVGEMESQLAPALDVSAEELGGLSMEDYRRIRAAQGARGARW